MSESSTQFIPTRGSSLKKDASEQFQVVSYISYKKVNKCEESIKDDSPEMKKNEKDIPNFDIKKVKHEVVKLGMSALDPIKKEEAKIQLAIKLGAKPPKNKHKNYKLLLMEKKKEKIQHVERNAFNQLGKNSDGKSTAKGKSFDRKRRKVKGTILGNYGVVKKPIASSSK